MGTGQTDVISWRDRAPAFPATGIKFTKSFETDLTTETHYVSGSVPFPADPPSTLPPHIVAATCSLVVAAYVAATAFCIVSATIRWLTLARMQPHDGRALSYRAGAERMAHSESIGTASFRSAQVILAHSLITSCEACG